MILCHLVTERFWKKPKNYVSFFLGHPVKGVHKLCYMAWFHWPNFLWGENRGSRRNFVSISTYIGKNFHEQLDMEMKQCEAPIKKINVSKLVRQRSYWRRSGEYVQRRVCFVNIQSSLHENVVFSVCACMGNAAYIIFIMWNSISSLDAWYHFRFDVSCGVAVTMSGHQKKFR